MALLGTIQSLQTNNKHLVGRIKIIENQRLSEQMDIMINRIDSISKDTRKLSEKIHTVEFDIQNFSKIFDKVADRMYLQMAIYMISKKNPRRRCYL